MVFFILELVAVIGGLGIVLGLVLHSLEPKPKSAPKRKRKPTLRGD